MFSTLDTAHKLPLHLERVHDDTINIKYFDPNLLYVDKLSFKNTDTITYNIRYITRKSLDNDNTHFVFNNLYGYIKESFRDKYLIFVSTDKNRKVLKKYTELWNEIKNKTETKHDGKPIKYKKYFMKIKFESYDDLPLRKILSILSMIIVVRSVFQKDNKFYSKVYLFRYKL